MPNQETVVAVFDTQGQAEGAIDALWHAGFAKNHIGMAAPGKPMQQASTATEDLEERAADGAIAGAVTGGALGAVAGAAVVSVIPGIGPVLAMGLLLGLTTGAALGTFAGPFLALGLSKEHAATYQADLKAGRTIVVVRTDQPEKAMMIVQAHSPRFVEEGGRRVMPLAK
jgi:hypothetical protein